MSKKNGAINLILAVVIVLVIASLIPFIYASKFAYPWADDFAYGAKAHEAFMTTGSVVEAISGAAETARQIYFDWQGTYTSCFLMALQPAVWNVKLYHLTGVIMVGAMLLAYVAFGLVLFNKILRMPRQVALSITLLVYLASIQMATGIAEGFTWFNSAVHYTFMHSLFIFFVAMVLSFLGDVIRNKNGMNVGKVAVREVLLCVLAIIVAGGNNLTTLGGVLTVFMTEGALLFYYLVYTKKKGKEVLAAGKLFLPIMIAYLIGFLCNVLAPGNSKRMAISVGERKTDFISIVIKAFRVCVVDIKDKMTLEILMILLIVAVLTWYSFTKFGALEKVDFSFPLPGLVILASFCFVAALYCPMLLVTDLNEEFKYIYIDATVVARTENVVFFFMVLLSALDIIYCLGWLNKKGLHFSVNWLSFGIAIVAAIVCAAVVKGNLQDYKRTYLTAAAVRDIQNQTAQYYGYQMAVNTQRLASEDSDVLVMPIAVDPKTLFPYDAADWKEGTRGYYHKNTVEYESEPYKFDR